MDVDGGGSIGVLKRHWDVLSRKGIRQEVDNTMRVYDLWRSFR